MTLPMYDAVIDVAGLGARPHTGLGACADAQVGPIPPAPRAPLGPSGPARLSGSAHLSRRELCSWGIRGAVALGAASMLALAGCTSGAAASDPAAASAGEKSAPSPTPDDPAASAAPTQDAAASAPVKRSTFAFNTLVSVSAYGVTEEQLDEALALCARYEDLFSARKEGTDIARVNAAGGAPVEVDPDTADLVARAVAYGDATDGAFDPTVGAVSLLWDFVEGVKPDDAAIREAVGHIDYTKVRVDGATVTLLDPQAKLDLGGIAKGWIAERLVEHLRADGSTSALVSLGTSSTYALGAKPDGSPWRIGLRDPKGDLSEILGVIEVTDVSVTSSGLYDQQFELDGRTYWHILDPATGYPAQTDMLGDTVICADPTEGDATSTALFTMGIAGAADWLARNRPQTAALFIGEDDEPVFANGLAETYRYLSYDEYRAGSAAASGSVGAGTASGA